MYDVTTKYEMEQFVYSCMCFSSYIDMYYTVYIYKWTHIYIVTAFKWCHFRSVTVT